MTRKNKFKSTNEVQIENAPETIRKIRNLIGADPVQNQPIKLTPEGKTHWQKLINWIETTDEIAFLYDSKHILKHFGREGTKIFKPSDIGKHAHQLLMFTADRHLKCPEKLNQFFQNQQQSVYEIIRAFDGKKNIPLEISTYHLIQKNNGEIIRVSMRFTLISTENNHLVGTLLRVEKEVIEFYQNIQFFKENGIVSPTAQELVEIYGSDLLREFLQDKKFHEILDVAAKTDDPFIIQLIWKIVLEMKEMVVNRDKQNNYFKRQIK